MHLFFQEGDIQEHKAPGLLLSNSFIYIYSVVWELCVEFGAHVYTWNLPCTVLCTLQVMLYMYFKANGMQAFVLFVKLGPFLRIFFLLDNYWFVQ